MRRELTKAEKQVACLIALGFMHKEIAARLFIAPKTVDKHVCSLYRKLAIHDSVRLTHYALARGWIQNLHAAEM